MGPSRASTTLGAPTGMVPVLLIMHSCDVCDAHNAHACMHNQSPYLAPLERKSSHCESRYCTHLFKTDFPPKNPEGNSYFSSQYVG